MKTYIQISVSPEEKSAIEAQAKIENYRNVAEFIRKTLLDRAKKGGTENGN